MPRSSGNKLYLIHPTRLQIYKIICETPGSYFYKLMGELPKYSKKISTATLIYHLKKLNDANLIETAKIDGKRLYYPKKLRDFDTERAYMLLQNENARKIFTYIINHEGAYQNEIARHLNLHHDSIYHHVKRLSDAELIERIKEGKYSRFRIGRLGKALLEGSLNIITQEYVNFIVSQLEDSCHFPEVVYQSKDKLVIRVVCPDEDDITLEINLSDFNLMELETEENKEGPKKGVEEKSNSPKREDG